jgi:hypothetical protein
MPTTPINANNAGNANNAVRGVDGDHDVPGFGLVTGVM